MRNIKYILITFVLGCVLVTSAFAGEVRVFMPKDEELSHMALRNKAMAEGFALAVLEEAKVMLPGELDEVRSELLKEYMRAHAKPYIQGYKILSTQAMEEGITLNLDVRVNKRSLRSGLRSMGLFATTLAPQAASVTWPEDISEEAMAQLQGLMTLTGIQNTPEVFPAFKLEPGPEKTFKGRMELDKQEWVSINKDMAVVWFNSWSKFFNRNENQQVRVGVQKLAVAGWFSPDAALEFDRVLHSWDSAVQDVQLVELDMQPTGVGGTWELRLISGERFDMLLRSYLPQRGLTYQMSEDAKE